MRVLQLISSGGFFGAENILIELAGGLAHLGAEPIVGVFRNRHNPHLEIADRARDEGLETAIFPCRGRVDWLLLRGLRDFMRRRQIDVVHSHGYKSNLYALAARPAGVRAVTTCHNWPKDTARSRVYALLDQLFLRRFDQVVAVSERVRESIVQSGVPSARVRVIDNGIQAERFARSQEARMSLRRELRVPDDAVVIGTVGRISAEKGHRFLLEAFRSMVKHSRPDAILLLVGDGPLKARLEREFPEPWVRFTGARKDMPAVYSALDIFVLPSLTEGLPTVLLEAMAAGLPTVATDVGAVSRVLADTGLLVPSGCVGDLMEAIMSCIRDPRKARAMGQAGLERVQEHFSSRRMSREYMAIYRGLVN